MFWSKLCKSNRNCAWNLAFISCIYLTYCMEYVWTSSLWIGIFQRAIHNEQEYFWPTIYRAGAAVVSTITSLIIRSYMMFQRYFVLHDLFLAHCVMKTSHHKKRFNITDLLCLEFPFHNFSIKNKRKLLSITRRKYNIGGNRSVGVSKNSSLYSSRLHLWFSSLQ